MNRYLLQFRGPGSFPSAHEIGFIYPAIQPFILFVAVFVSSLILQTNRSQIQAMAT